MNAEGCAGMTDGCMEKRPEEGSTRERWRLHDPRRLEVLASGVRQDIVDTLLTREEMPVRELARELGHRPSGLYYHLDRLEEVGLVTRTERTREDGRAETRYSVPSLSMEIEYRPGDPANEEAVVRVVRSLLRLAERDFERGFEHPEVEVDGERRNLWGARGKAWLSSDEIARANRLLRQLSDLFSRSGRREGDVLCTLTWVITPVTPRS